MTQSGRGRRPKSKSDSDTDEHNPAILPQHDNTSSATSNMSKRERNEYCQKNKICFRCEQPGHIAKDQDQGGRLHQQRTPEVSNMIEEVMWKHARKLEGTPESDSLNKQSCNRKSLNFTDSQQPLAGQSPPLLDMLLELI